MRSKLSIVAMLLLAFAGVCFVCTPAMSIEDPWDVDGGSSNDGGLGSDGDDTDTSDYKSDEVPEYGSTRAPDGSSWTEIVWDMNIWFAGQILEIVGYTDAYVHPAGTSNESAR